MYSAHKGRSITKFPCTVFLHFSKRGGLQPTYRADYIVTSPWPPRSCDAELHTVAPALILKSFKRPPSHGIARQRCPAPAMHGPGTRDAAPTNACGQLCHLRSLRCSESTRRGGKSIRCCTPMTSRPREARQDYQHHRTRHNTADGRYHLHHSRRCRSLLVDMHVNRKQKKNHGCPRPLYADGAYEAARRRGQKNNGPPLPFPALCKIAGKSHQQYSSNSPCGGSTAACNLRQQHGSPPRFLKRGGLRFPSGQTRTHSHSPSL